MRLFILITLILATLTTVMAQTEYEPNEQHPYGQPNPDAPQQLSDFSPLIGTCDCTSESRNADKTWAAPINMTWTFKYIMNGMAIQDETLKEDGKHSGNIRQFNTDSLKWYVHYYSSSSSPSILPTWSGGKKDGKITLYREQKSPNGIEGYYKITFSEISEAGFNWLGEWTDTSESFSYPTWRISCKKRR